MDLREVQGREDDMQAVQTVKAADKFDACGGKSGGVGRGALCVDCSGADARPRKDGVSCAACAATKPRNEFDENVYRHWRDDGRNAVCRECYDEGYSVGDCSQYFCHGCGPRGHLMFDSQQLRRAKRTGAHSVLFCKDCSEREGTARKKPKSR